MKVTSTNTIEFPKLAFVINKGEVVDLPTDEEAQAIILASPYVSKVDAVVKKSETTK